MNVLIYLAFLKVIFVSYRVLGWHLFPAFRLWIPMFLASLVSDMKLTIILTEGPLYVMSCFFLCAWLSAVCFWCFQLWISFEFIPLGVCCDSWMGRLIVSPNLESFLSSFFQIFFRPYSCFPFPLGLSLCIDGILNSAPLAAEALLTIFIHFLFLFFIWGQFDLL